MTAVECAGKHGGRMASVAGTEDIDNILTSTVDLRDKWVGSYKQGKPKLNCIDQVC